MTCETCGRQAEDGQQAHWLGCEEAVKQWADTVTETGQAAPLVGDLKPAGLCEHDECSESKKPWAGKGAKPKYCAAGHKKEK